MAITNAIAPVASNGVPAATAAVTAPTPGAQALPTAQPASLANPTAYNPAPVTGGGFGADIANAVTRLTAYASKKMQDTQNEISALFNSEGQPLDAAKLQVYNQRMSMLEMTMQMAAKLQEKEENSIAVWVRP